MTRISLIMRSFFGCLSRSICLMATERFVPTWYAVYTPPDALQYTKVSLGQVGNASQTLSKYPPLPDFNQITIQSCWICICADSLQALDNIEFTSFFLLFSPPRCRNTLRSSRRDFIEALSGRPRWRRRRTLRTLSCDWRLCSCSSFSNRGRRRRRKSPIRIRRSRCRCELCNPSDRRGLFLNRRARSRGLALGNRTYRRRGCVADIFHRALLRGHMRCRRRSG